MEYLSEETNETNEMIKLDEEVDLSNWINKELEANPNQLKTVDKTLVDECRAIRQKMENITSWSRYVPKDVTRTEWIRRISQTISCYRQCWLELALVSYKHIFDLKANLNENYNENPIKVLSNNIVPSEMKWFCSEKAIAIRLLCLIYFLDHAKRNRLLSHQPSLFILTNKVGQRQVYSSEQVASTFILNWLAAGMGNQLKAELRSIDFNVQQVECEANVSIDFSIHQLSQDLCDGFRLAKLLEILFASEKIDLVSKLKFPTNRTADRITNMIRLFDSYLWFKLRKFDPQNWSSTIDSQTVAREIACGYRETTIRVLRSMQIMRFKVNIECYYWLHLDQIVLIQRWLKACFMARRDRQSYIQLRCTTIWIQRCFRRKMKTNQIRNEYVRLRKATLFMQRRFRLNRNRNIILDYVYRWLNRRQVAAITVQRHWRGVWTRWQARQLYGEQLMNRICSIELNQALPNVRDPIGVKCKELLQRLRSTMINGKRTLRSVTILSNDLKRLYGYIYCSVEIRYQIVIHHCWVVSHCAELLQRLNRSEHHKLIAYFLLSILDHLSRVELMTTPDDRWLKACTAIIHLMTDYINYPQLMQQAIRILCQLAKREKMDESNDNGWKIVKMVENNERTWQRLIGRIRAKYKSDHPKTNINEIKIRNCHPSDQQFCMCHSVTSQFARLNSLINALHPKMEPFLSNHSLR